MGWGGNDTVFDGNDTGFDNTVDYVVLKNMRSRVLFASDMPPGRGAVQLGLLAVALGCVVVQSNKYNSISEGHSSLLMSFCFRTGVA